MICSSFEAPRSHSTWTAHTTSPILLPLAAASLAAAPAAPVTPISTVLGAAAALLWEAALPSAALCEPAGISNSTSGDSRPAANAGFGGAAPPSGEHHFPEDAPQLPAGALREFRGGSRRLSNIWSACSPFYGAAAGPAGAGGGRGGSSFPDDSDADSQASGAGLVRSFVHRGKARMQARRAAAAGRWIRMRRLLNRILGTNEVASVRGFCAAILCMPALRIA